MSIIKVLLQEIDRLDKNSFSQLKEICDQISEEEKKNLLFPEIAPTGPNVLLVVGVPGRYTWEVGYLTLELEDVETYIMVYHTIEKDRIDINKSDLIYPRRKKVWKINEHKPEKILTEFAKKLKILRGE